MERKSERSGPKIQMSGTVEKNERSAEREVAEREWSGERAESAAHAAKGCTICTVNLSEAKRHAWHRPGTSRLHFDGNPMNFFSFPHFHPDKQLWSPCNVSIHYTVSPISGIAGLRLRSTLCIIKVDFTRLFCYNIVYKQKNFICFAILYSMKFATR